MDQQYSSILLENAVNEFAKLPGIGRKTALRLVLHLLRQEEGRSQKNSVIPLSSYAKKSNVATFAITYPTRIPVPFVATLRAMPPRCALSRM